MCGEKKIHTIGKNTNSSSTAFIKIVSSGKRKSRTNVGGKLQTFVADSAMLFTAALACIPRKDCVRNHADRPWSVPFSLERTSPFYQMESALS